MRIAAFHRWSRRPLLVLSLGLAAALLPGVAQARAVLGSARCLGLLGQLALGAVMLALTAAVHALVTVYQVEALQYPWLVGWCRRTGMRRMLVVVAMALLTALSLLVDILLWGLLYQGLGLFDGFEASLVFAGSTFATVGFVDLSTLPACWRFLAVAEAINGVLMAGWSTAQQVYVVKGVIQLRLQSEGRLSNQHHAGPSDQP